MSAVCQALGVARSNVHVKVTRDTSWRDGRRGRTASDDTALVAEIREHIADLASYGYRRATALVNTSRKRTGLPPVNHKRCYRVMAQHQLLLPKAPRRVHSRRHDGRVAVDHSDTRWCSDGFEIACQSGEVVTAAFTKDCCDREIVARRAWPGRGLPGEPVREMLIEAVEARFGSVDAVPSDHTLEFLSDNGGAYIAHDTKEIAKSLGLKPVTTPGGLQLFQLSTLSTLIERMLADPRRIMAVRLNMHLGQTVRFVDWRDGSLREGQVLVMKDTQVTLKDLTERREWKLPYAAIEPPAPNATARARAASEAPPTMPPKPTRNDFRCGEKVAFEDKYLQTVVGTIVRINDRTASIDPGDGTKRRVGFSLLRHVLDV